MQSSLFTNFGIAFTFGFRRALNLNQSHPIRLYPPISCKNCHDTPLSTGKVLRYSSNLKAMSASRSIVPCGDVIVDGLVTGWGDVSTPVKPGRVFFSDRSSKLCRKAMIGVTSVDGGSCGGHGSNVYDSNTWHGFSKGLNHDRSFSSSCHSDGTVPEVSSDGSSVVEHLSNLAVSTEERIPTRNTGLKLLSGACYLPHPAKEETGGEDAHFICNDEQVIGVADGVGGWADVGINAGEYARELMNNSVKAIRESADGDVDPLKVLEKAHTSTNAMGSSTACIIALKNQGIHAINLGDSGFIIVRDGRTIFESPVQQHGFNFTYQLERSDRGDLPSSGQVFKIPVVPGDVIVAGSDGLFDNLYSTEIAGIIGDAVREGLSPDAMAQRIAAVARVRALDKTYQSPFAAAAQQAGFMYFGGKLDDLTVLVSYVSAPTDA